MEKDSEFEQLKMKGCQCRYSVLALVTILKVLGYGVESKSITTYTIDEGKCPAWIHYVQAQYTYILEQ